MNSGKKKGLLFSVLVVISMALTLVQPAAATQSAQPLPQGNGPTPPLRPTVTQSLYNVTTPPLREFMATYEPPKDGNGEFHIVPNKPLYGKTGQNPASSDHANGDKPQSLADLTNTLGFIDPLLKKEWTPDGSLQTVRSFSGLTQGDNVATLGGGVAPPDTVGAVGPNHYVQAINLVWSVFDKTTGAKLLGPMTNNALWVAASTGDACAADNDGDPIVLYDEAADRWLFSQFAVSSADNTSANPYYECIAISASGDPTGAWYVYSFPVSDTKMNDYPHFGVWPDGYYMSVNQFTNGTTWGGQGAVAFERSVMLTGGAAKMVTFDLDPSVPAYEFLGGMLPSNLEGSTAPPAGTPNYFMEVDDDAWPGISNDQLQIWAFHVDWTTPANSTFTLQNTLPTTAFDSDMCGGSRDCIEQPGTTQKLDVIADRLMYSMQYRNFGTHQSMVVNHTVDMGGDHAGIRWYELRRTTGNWSIYQQGDYSPDSDNRWMGSISMDGDGNIALGYSVSSSTTYPSVRYTGRLAGDPLNTMTQGENSIVEGGGSQLGVNRWGDYSMMDVDPADDCTFWYTQDYVATTGKWNWATRIGAFKMPGCGVTWGSLGGNVTDSVSGNPIVGALVTITGGATATTDSNGDYLFTGLPAGSYSVTTSEYWHWDNISNPSVVDGAPTTNDVVLVPRNVYTISGAVTDGSGQGWPLYASIQIPEYPGGTTLYTNPETGAYTIDLAEGRSHTFTTTALSGGYEADVQVVAPAASGTLNIPLTVDAVACTAPGYSYTSNFAEDFESGVPPTGWSTSDNAGASFTWDTSANWGDSNYTDGSGIAAEASSDVFGPSAYDTDLVTPVITTASLSGNYNLTYLANFQNYAGYDFLDLDINVDGGGWTTLLSWNEDHGSLYSTPGEAVSVDLTASLTGSTSFQLRWRYYDPYVPTPPATQYHWNWYVQVDEISIGACNPDPSVDGLVVGTVSDVNGQPALGATVSYSGGTPVYTNTLQEGPDNGSAFYFLPAPQGVQNITAKMATSTTASVTVSSAGAIRHDFALSEANITFTGDFNGNGKADVAVFRPSTGTWYILGMGATKYGQSGDIPVPADYDGDSKANIAVFRPSTGYWYRLGIGKTKYGQPGDVPVPADYNGDGNVDIAVYRPSTGYWYILGMGATKYGQSGDIPVPADYDGDGNADIAIYRPSTGYWYILGMGGTKYGQASDTPVPGDYDSDGSANIAIYRPSTGYWYILGMGSTKYGRVGDIPVPGDYDGDGTNDIAVFRPSTGYWYRLGLGAIKYGQPGDVPVAPEVFPDATP